MDTLPQELLIQTMINMPFKDLETFKNINKHVYQVYKQNKDVIFKRKLFNEFPCFSDYKDVCYII